MVEVDEALQDELHSMIYNPLYGIKVHTRTCLTRNTSAPQAVYPVSAKARSSFVRYVHMLVHKEAQCVVLGCTEIPLALPVMCCPVMPFPSLLINLCYNSVCI